MQQVRTIVDTGEVLATEVRCRHERPAWSDAEPIARSGIVLVRSGLFRREADGAEDVVDVCAGYLQSPGSEQRIAHPVGDDVCTFVSLPPDLCDDVPPDQVVPVDARLDLAHRTLVARSRTGATPEELGERAVVLAGSVVSRVLPEAVAAGLPRRPTTVADGIREVLADRPQASLGELADSAGLSAYHVSRVFRRTTGMTITAYRSRLRARRALERLAAGEDDLATLAIETGYADQPHLTREFRRETGQTPAHLRAAFGEVADASAPVKYDRPGQTRYER